MQKTPPSDSPKDVVVLTYKYRVKDKSARKALQAHATAVNQVWNWCVARHRHHYRAFQAGKQWQSLPDRFDLQDELSGAGKEIGIHQHTVQEAIRFFVQSRTRLQGRAKRLGPRFRVSFGARRSLGWVPFTAQSRQIDGNSVVYKGKRYRFFGNKRRPLPVDPMVGKVKGGCFVQDASGHWYVCFTVEMRRDALPERRQTTGSGEIGIDLGLKALATLSDGQSFAPGQHYRQMEDRLGQAQRRGERQMARRIHRRIRRRRQDELHKLSAHIARTYSFIAVGDVSSSSLAQTEKAKSVLDAGWSMFRTMLRYKASMHRAVYLEIDERNTTRACSACRGLTGPTGEAGLSVRRWTCTTCNADHDRDQNAAINILRLAQTLSVQGHVKPEIIPSLG